jgi:hypothetical protein
VWQQERLAEAEKRAEKAEAERDSYSYLEAQIAALQSDEFANQMATNLGASVTRLAELVIERDKLRAALIEVGRNAGASLADTVSTEFLTGVPEEVKLVIDRLRQELEHLQAVAKERQTVLDAYQRREDPEEAYARGWADHLNYRSYSPRKEQ